MDLVFAAKYPFSLEAKKIVKNKQISLKQVLGDGSIALELGKKRIIQALEQELYSRETKNPEKESVLKSILTLTLRETKRENELLAWICSYPAAKMMAKKLSDFEKQKYVDAEANLFLEMLRIEEKENVEKLAEELGVETQNDSVRVLEYLKNAPKEEEFRLVNQSVGGGRVFLDDEGKKHLMAEALRKKLASELKEKTQIPQEFSAKISEYAKEAEKEARVFKKTYEPITGPVETKDFPPCISLIYTSLSEGKKISHNARFALATFLINIGMSTEEIISLFKNAPNFRPEKTKYYLDNLSGKKGGTKYSALSCRKMDGYGLCIGADKLCEKIKHPLSYYKRRKK